MCRRFQPVDNGVGFKITRGRHPVVEAALQADNARGFVPNDCDLSPGSKGRLWLVTGPNMAGKSTFLRQNALIAILAQSGSFVPADAAHIGIVDRLFLARGRGQRRSGGRPFHLHGLEMVETAAILNQATNKSLVILDEIGRGTATYDGLAIAWAAAEHLHESNKSRALFATHYHEMVALCERLDAMTCVTMKVKEWNDSIVFLHEVTPGAADRSYGIHVAKLARLAPMRWSAGRKKCCARWKKKAARVINRWHGSTICRCSAPPRPGPRSTPWRTRCAQSSPTRSHPGKRWKSSMTSSANCLRAAHRCGIGDPL